MTVISSIRRQLKPQQRVIDFSSGGVCIQEENTLRDFIDNEILNTRIDSYGSVLGINELRLSMATINKAFFKNDISDKNVAITHGANKGFCIATEAISKITGKKGILFFSPHFHDSYENALRNNLKVHTLERKYTNNFEIEVSQFKEVLEDKKSEISMVYLVNPDNPTGNYIKKETIEEISKFCEKKNIYLILDHSFYGMNLISNSIMKSYYKLYKTTMIIGGLSKSFGLAGLRVGYAIMPTSIVETYENIQDCDHIHHPVLDQKIAFKVMKNHKERLSLVLKNMQPRSHKFRIQLSHLRGIESLSGSYWLSWVKINRKYLCQKFDIKESFDISQELLEKEQIGIVPGVKFGEEFEDFIRIAYGRETLKNFEEGLVRLVRFFC